MYGYEWLSVVSLKVKGSCSYASGVTKLELEEYGNVTRRNHGDISHGGPPFSSRTEESLDNVSLSLSLALSSRWVLNDALFSVAAFSLEDLSAEDLSLDLSSLLLIFYVVGCFVGRFKLSIGREFSEHRSLLSRSPSLLPLLMLLQRLRAKLNYLILLEPASIQPSSAPTKLLALISATVPCDLHLVLHLWLLLHVVPALAQVY